ncbi:MAG: putative bifunctional diguanylate cyclase/phosphodiesterase [Rhodoferax sp.]
MAKVSEITNLYEPVQGSADEIDKPISTIPSGIFLKYVIFSMVVGAVGFLIVMRLLVPDQTARAIGPLLLLFVAVAGWYLLTRGRTQATIKVLVYGSWLAATAISATQGGVRTSIIIAYPLIILIIGWLISLRVAQVVAGLTVTAILGFVLGESWGFLPIPQSTPPIMHGIVQIVVVLASTLLIVFLVRAYQSRLKELHSVGRDLSSRTAELESNKAALHRAQAVAKVGSWDFDLVTDTMYLSPETCRIFDLPEGTRSNHDDYLAQVHPDDQDWVDRTWMTAINGEAFAIEHRIRVGNAVRWIRQKAELEFSSDGTPLRAVGTAQDITERKEVEGQLRIAAAAFESLEGMMITDVNSVILQVNRAFTQITGYTAEEALGQTPRLLQAGRHNEAFYLSMWECIQSTGGWQGEMWNRKKNGKEYPILLTISAVKDDRGTVTHYVGAQLDITERKKAEVEIAGLAFSDQLTGLPNRRLLLDRLKQTMTASSRSGCHGALMMIDLDNFKTLNDTLGHDMGDLLLMQVGQRLTTCVRGEDTVARLGGDEFVVMLASLSTSEADAAAHTKTVGNKILSALNQTYRLADVDYRSTPSIGATLFSGHLTTIDDLMKQADLAMYKSKESGRNALHFFDLDMEIVAVERAALETGLREAIANKQFVLYYQAQVVGEGLVTGAEVLVRWQHPQRGIVSPAEFIPLAEESGLILPLGQWIMETACTQLALWADRPEMTHLTLAVNVSAHQFRQRDFVDQVLAILKDTGANPLLLKLELTESILVTNIEDVVEKMFALKAKGVGFSLDDFGTGYSSLSYLKRLPIDHLKIDQSFVRDVLSDPNDAAIARTIIALAKSLGLGAIAEGVETASQRDFLVSSGCHAFQGYFYSRPLPIEGFEAFASPG